ncbi:MAG: hypothetical protein ACREPA_09155 [Candidatus Dormibacteraceae bacterium]
MEQQLSCDRCGGSLTPGASYCDACGSRTRRALKNVRFAIRLELVFIALVIVLILGFTVIFANQPPTGH